MVPREQKTCGGGSVPVQNDIPKPHIRLCGILFSFSTFSSSHWACIHTTYTASYLLHLPSVRGRGWPGQDLASLSASWNTPQRSRLYAALSSRLPPRMPMVAGHMRMLVGLRIPALERSNSIPRVRYTLHICYQIVDLRGESACK